MAVCVSCGKPTPSGSHCADCLARQQANVAAALKAPPGPLVPAAPVTGVVITDVQIGFGRLVELGFLLTFAAIPAGLVLGLAWAVARVLVHSLF